MKHPEHRHATSSVPVVLAGCALNTTAMAWKDNLAILMTALHEARSQGAHVVVTPELALSGYSCGDWFLSDDVHQHMHSSLEALLPHTADLAVLVGLPVRHQGRNYNAAAWLVDGQLRAVVPKQHLAHDGMHDEPRWFQAWPQGALSTWPWQGSTVPFGDLILDLGGVRLGVEICRDAWVSPRVGAHHIQRGVDVILNPTSSHFAFGKAAQRKQLNQEGTFGGRVAHLLVNQLGMDGSGVVFDGEILCTLPDGSTWQTTRLNLAPHNLLVRPCRIQPGQHPEHPHLCTVPWSWADKRPDQEHQAPAEAPWERLSGTALCCEEFMRMTTLGLRDYWKKTGTRGAVLSLSGGADSALCAVLLAFTIARMHQETGAGLIEGADQATELKTSLTAVYQSSAHSSHATQAAAQALAEALGMTFIDWSIRPMVDAYEALGAQVLGRPLSWEQDDVARQNIQARVRGPGAWLVANLKNALLISTSNRSEISTGYATMDGDTCGALALLAGIDKPFVLQLLRFLEAQGWPGLWPPIASLSTINAFPPSAELRPEAQTDEADLMPYPLLNAIEQAMLGQHLDPRSVVAQVRPLAQELGWSEPQLKRAVVRFAQLWVRNQWKRQRAAFSFKADQYNLSPVGYRFPILSGGFKDELAALVQEATQEESDSDP